MSERVAVAAVRRLGRGKAHTDQDLVAVEAPLAITVRREDRQEIRSLGILMRTPGDDEDLVRGLLYAEGLIRQVGDVTGVTTHADAVEVTLPAHVDVDSLTSERATIATSACGLCGRLSIDRLESLGHQLPAMDAPMIDAAVVSGLPAALRQSQPVFAETGGLHAAGLFDAAGRLHISREDVGRHCAVDKVIGAAFGAGLLPARESLLVVSGRVAFEIVQKAAMAGVPIVIAVGAPSSLAVDAARATGQTLIGFTRSGRFNVYTGYQRLLPDSY